MPNYVYDPEAGNFFPASQKTNTTPTAPVPAQPGGGPMIDKKVNVTPGAMPDVSDVERPDLITIDPSKNWNNKYLTELEALHGTIPSLFAGKGTGGGVSKLNAQSVADEGWSNEFNDFSSAFRNNMLNSLSPEANPFGQEDLNVVTGDVNRQFQQYSDSLREQATREGWLNTPKYDSAVRNMKFENILLNQTNRREYETAKSNWDFTNRQIVSAYYQAYTNEETQNRNFKLQTGKINADFAWAAAQKNAALANSAVRQARADRLLQYNMTEQGILTREALEGRGIGLQLQVDQYNLETKQADQWRRYDAMWDAYAFEEGVEAGEQESRNSFIGTIAGGIGGFLIGGPVGAAVGAAVGGG